MAGIPITSTRAEELTSGVQGDVSLGTTAASLGSSKPAPPVLGETQTQSHNTLSNSASNPLRTSAGETGSSSLPKGTGAGAATGSAAGSPFNADYHSIFYNTLTWQNPVKSGIAFASIVSSTLFFQFVNISRFFFLAAWTSLAAIIGVEIAGKLILQKQRTVGEFAPRRYFTIKDEALLPLVKESTSLLNFFIVEAQKLLFVEKTSHTISALVVSYLSYKLVTHLPLWSLFIIFVSIAFVAPPVYLSHQKEIDEQIARAQDLAAQQYGKARTQAGVYSDKALQAGKGYAGTIQTKLPPTLQAKLAQGPGVQTTVVPPTEPATSRTTAPTTL